MVGCCTYGAVLVLVLSPKISPLYSYRVRVDIMLSLCNFLLSRKLHSLFSKSGSFPPALFSVLLLRVCACVARFFGAIFSAKRHPRLSLEILPTPTYTTTYLYLDTPSEVS